MKAQFFLPLMTYPDHTSEIVISNAINLAGNCGAMLWSVALEVTMPTIIDPWAPLLIDVDQMVREAESTSRTRCENLTGALKHQCSAAAVDCTCETLVVIQPDAVDKVMEIARHHDLTILQATAEFGSLSHAVIFGSGRPVMLLPDKPFGGRVEHVAIAWDGSRAAARALADATPFISAASRVSIIYALDEKPIEVDPGRRLFDSFEKRGVMAEAYPIHVHDRPIGDVLQEKAAELQADILVMGGYGHSRMREFILGGATADVLGNPLLPILMSH
jgi:nucleotide-binding universal stress UspA family protein